MTSAIAAVQPVRRRLMARASHVLSEWRLVLPLTVVAVAIVFAVLGPLFAPHEPNEIAVDRRLQGPRSAFPLGTDSFGRDMLSRLIVGTRISVIVAFGVAGTALLAGFPLGLAAGYLRGRVDFAIGRILELILSFPGLLLALALTTVLGAGLDTVIIALTIVYVPIVARFIRSAVLAEREREYVIAARIGGASTWRILARHIVPNIASPVLVLVTSIMAFTVLAEAALSYLGFGTQPPSASWGRLLAENAPYLAGAPYLVIFPGVAISLLVLAFNLAGDALRDRLDPRHRSTLEAFTGTS